MIRAFTDTKYIQWSYENQLYKLWDELSTELRSVLITNIPERFKKSIMYKNIFKRKI